MHTRALGFLIAASGLMACGPQTSDVAYRSGDTDFAPVQTAGAGLPAGANALSWVKPAQETSRGSFSGSPGQRAGHEGVDLVNNKRGVDVSVVAAAAGKVVYFQIGCPQSSEFSHNTSVRECGAGWGNHVVIEHAGGIYTRYGHLKPGTIAVELGDQVRAGQKIALMGNSGRSELRHLHFELGTGVRGGAFDNTKPTRSFQTVYNPELLPWGSARGVTGNICESLAHTITPFRYILTGNLHLQILDAEQRVVTEVAAVRKNDAAAVLGGQSVNLLFDARSGTVGAFIYRLKSNGKVYLKHDGQGDRIPMRCE